MMTHSRRYFLTSLSAFSLTACGARFPISQSLGAETLPDDLRPVQTAAFSEWVSAFRPRALNAGISPATFDSAFADAGFIPGVVTRDGNQIQTSRSFEDYLAIATSEERITKGRAAYSRYARTLDAVEAQYGVEKHIVTAIWGMESLYGEKRGIIPVISSTATLAFDGRRGVFYESQLIAALKILERGDTTPAQMVGSWAGAMGHTQFIPTSYQSFAVDFTGDGRRDIWSDDPTDSLASTAAYLSRNGWRRGVPWGAEEGTTNLSGTTVQPQAGGVRFTVTRNFTALKSYNNSDFYAVGIGLLADRIAGGGPLRGSFPPDANGLTRADRLNLQAKLNARGYDIGTPDGVIGPRSEAAIRAFQQRQGVPVTGVATRDVLNALN